MKTNLLSLFASVLAILAVTTVANPIPIDFSLFFNGQYYTQIFVNMPPTNTFLIKESSDLINWRPHTSVFSNVPQFRFSDQEFVPSASRPARFYKIDGPAESPTQMQQHWEALAIKKYRFVEGRRCYWCNAPFAATVTVENGVVISVENPVNQDGSPAPGADPSELKSIEEMFNIVQGFIGGVAPADVVVVDFDNAQFFPSWIRIDPTAIGSGDDEFEYSVSNLEILE